MIDTLLPIDIKEAFKGIKDYWSPQIIGEVNDAYVKIAKLKGEFVWHDHQNEDELFYVVKGSLNLELKNQLISLKEGQMFIVPKATLHKPVAIE